MECKLGAILQGSAGSWRDIAHRSQTFRRLGNGDRRALEPYSAGRRRTNNPQANDWHKLPLSPQRAPRAARSPTTRTPSTRARRKASRATPPTSAACRSPVATRCWDRKPIRRASSRTLIRCCWRSRRSRAPISWDVCWESTTINRLNQCPPRLRHARFPITRRARNTELNLSNHGPFCCRELCIRDVNRT